MKQLWQKEVQIVKELRDPNRKMKTKRQDFAKSRFIDSDPYDNGIHNKKIKKLAEKYENAIKEAIRQDPQGGTDLIEQEENRDWNQILYKKGDEKKF